MTMEISRYKPGELNNNPNYVHLENNFVPWTTLEKPLNECKISLVNMGGIYLLSQDPFDEIVGEEGDSSFRELPRSLRTGGFLISHRGYDHKWVQEDLNCLLPLEIFNQLEEEGKIGELAETHYSFMGSILNPLRLIADNAPEVGCRMRKNGVDICVLAST